MKRITKIFVALAMMLSFTTVDVSAATISGGLDFSNETSNVGGTIDGYYWDYDNLTLTLLENLTISTDSKYALTLPDGATVDLGEFNLTIINSYNDSFSAGIFSEGSITIEGSGILDITSDKGMGIYVKGDCEIICTGDIEIDAYNEGIWTYVLTVGCDNLTVNSTNSDAISVDKVEINAKGNIIISTEKENSNYAGIYSSGDITITSGGDLTITASNATGIYVYPWSDNDHYITFNVAGEVNINADIAIYLAGWYFMDTSTTIINNGGIVNLNSTNYAVSYDHYYYGDDGEDYYRDDSTYSLILQGSGEIYAAGIIYVSNLSVKDTITLYANDGIGVNDTLFIGVDATVETLGGEIVVYEIYGTLKAGILPGNCLNIYDGATVIIDTSLLDGYDYQSWAGYDIALFLTGSDEMMPSYYLGDNVVLYEPASPASFLSTTWSVNVAGDDEEPEYHEFPLITVINDGEDLGDDWSNVATYIVFTTIYDIDVTVEGEGSVTSDNDMIAKGEDVTYTFTPSEGYEISDVLVDDESVGVVASYTFESIAKGHTLEVVFTEIEDDTATEGGNDNDATEGESGVDGTVDTGDSNNILLYSTLSTAALALIYMEMRKRSRA